MPCTAGVRIGDRLQAVFQDRTASLSPRLTVAEIIAEPWEIHSVSLSPADRPARVAELLQQVGLDPSVAQRFPKPATCPGRC
jgi:ABC-type microcin C transport system duplicated ATPase subunit YejF